VSPERRTGADKDSHQSEVNKPSDDHRRALTCLSGSSGCEAIWPSYPPDCKRQCDERSAWKRDVALAVSVNVEHVPAIVRLEGMLEGATAVNVVAVIGELIREGHRNFKLETSALCVPTIDGIGALKTLQRMVQNSGGHLAWDGLTVNHPYPPKGDDLGRLRL
jgi:hypothetical protein